MGSSAKKARRKGGPQAKQPAGKGTTAPKPGAFDKRGQVAQTTATGEMDGATNIAWVCLNLLLIAVPLAMTNATWTGLWNLPFTYDQFDIAKVFVMRALTLVAYGALGWRLLTRGGRWRHSPMDWLVVAFLAWVAITTVLSIHPPTALFGKYRRFEGLISFVNYAAAFFLAVQFVDRPARIRALARSAFAGAVLVSAYGAMQVLGIDPIDWGSRLPFEAQRAFSTYGNPDLLGGYLVLVLPLGLALAFEERDEWRRALYWTGFLLVTYTWIQAFVRGAWIGGAFALAVLVFALVRRRERLVRVDYGFLAAIGVMVTFIVLRSLSAESEVMNVVARLRDILDFRSGSGLTRTQIWEAALAAVRDRPVFGFGADTFRLIFPRYKPVEYVAAAGYLSVADNAHSYPLQVMTALGVPGFLLLYGTFGFALLRSARTAFGREIGTERLLLSAMWAGAAGYLVHLLAGLSVTGSTLVLWILLGVLLAPLARAVELRAPSWGAVASVALVSAVVVGLVGNTVYIWADSRYLASRVAASPEEHVAQVESALALNPYNDMYRAELGLAYQSVFLARINELRGVDTQSPEARAVAEAAIVALRDAESAMRSTIAYVPWEYDNYVFLANLYNMAADFGLGDDWREKALRVAKEGIEVEPFGPAARLQLATALKGQGKTGEAIAELEKAVRMDPRYVEGNLALGDLYRESGETAKAAEAYTRVLAVEPENGAARNSLEAIEASQAMK